MKWTITGILSITLTTVALTACGNKEGIAMAEQNHREPVDVNDSITVKMKITVGSKSFSAILSKNSTAKAFIALLPMKIRMTELNGNEKYFDLAKDLPGNSFVPGRIYSGDLLLWGTKTLVVFYKTFNSSYSYSSICKINNPEGLAAALGTGNVEVVFELE
ncbi:cyclophilin-like fold protein [Chitinophaga deserti]|uniref:cyclophilin-like fold protein n=1 Tax=Chitinophaga deserti TaxID=2164099 RepID=UPI000D6AFFE3|nr:cyclophilin-like fold protein [Chitinophaga deserti]